MKIEERDRLTREAMANVKANRVIDHQIVHTWAESLDTDNPLPAPTTKKAAQQAASSKSNT
ncbi:MAG: hypothetical protein ABW084_00805 [Candidatus Thiodiazotropha sp.]